jgi:assimilatory nitrate reductase catalytic subunit
MNFGANDVDRVRRFWNAPHIATRSGLKAVDMFKAVGDGRIKAIWIAATNPAVSMPKASEVRSALENCPFVVVSDTWPTDTSGYAHIVLPAAAWAEKDGTVTNSERCISRQRAFRSSPGNTRPDWWMFAEVARRMGWNEEFFYPNPACIFREHAALSAFENGGTRIFDIGALAACDDAAYDALSPLQWPCSKDGMGASSRLFANGGFSTPDGRARMVPVGGHKDAEEIRPDFVLKLNTGRIRDQWHTMTRTGRVPRLMAHVSEPQLAIHPRDAVKCGITPDAFARIENEQGSVVMRALVTESQRPGEIFVPMHWTDQFSSAGAIDRLVHDKTDPISGQPDLKASRVRLSTVKLLWTGLLLRRAARTPDLGEGVYWSKAPLEFGFAFDLAGWTELASVVRSESILRGLLQISAAAELVSYSDPKKGVFRYAGLLDGRLEACLFLAAAGSELPSRNGAARLLGRGLEATERLALLAAHNHVTAAPPDPIVCACFAVGGNSVAATIRKNNLRNVGEIGMALQAGTNCGSCIPELKKLLQEARHAQCDLGTQE